MVTAVVVAERRLAWGGGARSRAIALGFGTGLWLGAGSSETTCQTPRPGATFFSAARAAACDQATACCATEECWRQSGWRTLGLG